MIFLSDVLKSDLVTQVRVQLSSSSAKNSYCNPSRYQRENYQYQPQKEKGFEPT